MKFRRAVFDLMRHPVLITLAAGLVAVIVMTGPAWAAEAEDVGPSPVIEDPSETPVDDAVTEPPADEPQEPSTPKPAAEEPAAEEPEPVKKIDVTDILDLRTGGALIADEVPAAKAAEPEKPAKPAAAAAAAPEVVPGLWRFIIFWIIAFLCAIAGLFFAWKFFKAMMEADEGTDEMIEIANELSPEHLEIHTRNARAVSRRIRNAGAVFVGEATPTALGDYLAGPSHTLPTGATARFFSGLSVHDFVRRMSVVEYSPAALRREAPLVRDFAEAEGLTAHALSVKRRADRKK